VTEAIGLMSQTWQAELESAAIEIGYAALLRIVGQKTGDRAMVESMVRAVLEQLPERRLLSIHLAPADHALFHDGKGIPPSLGAVLLADERVGMGGCIVETDAGSLDGRLETRLAELKAVLVEMHHAREMPQ
jgi:flagellar assembly protein FliH